MPASHRKKSELSTHQMAPVGVVAHSSSWAPAAYEPHEVLLLRLFGLRQCDRRSRPPVPFEVDTMSFFFWSQMILFTLPLCNRFSSMPTVLSSRVSSVFRARSTQSSSSFVADNACGRKGSSNLGLCGIWYISTSSAKRRA